MVKEKRKRGVPYLDNVDLEILEFLDTPNYSANTYGWGVLDIVNKLNIQHNNLKPHIDKLLRLNLICVVDKSSYRKKGKKIIENKKVGLISVRARNEDYIRDFEGDIEHKDFIKEAKEESEYFKVILKCLRDIRSYFYNKENEDYLNLDLRSKETQDALKDIRGVRTNIKETKKLNKEIKILTEQMHAKEFNKKIKKETTKK